MYSDFGGCNILLLSIRSNWPAMSFKITVALQIFWLDDLLIDVIEVFKFPTAVVLLSISSFMSVSVCFLYLHLAALGA